VEKVYLRAPQYLKELAEEKFSETKTCNRFTILKIDNTIVISVPQKKDKERLETIGLRERLMKRRAISIQPPDSQSLVKKGERDLKKIDLKKFVKVIK